MSNCYLIRLKEGTHPIFWKHVAGFRSRYDEVHQRLLERWRNFDKPERLQLQVDIFEFAKLDDFDAQAHDKKATDEEMLNRYFDAFNMMLFDRVLTKTRCPLTLANQNHPEWYKGLEGFTRECREDHKSGRFKIAAEIIIFEELNMMNRARKLRKYVQTLLHEMTNGFIQNFVCARDLCGKHYHQLDGATWATMAVACFWFEAISSRALEAQGALGAGQRSGSRGTPQ